MAGSFRGIVSPSSEDSRDAYAVGNGTRAESCEELDGVIGVVGESVDGESELVA